MVPAGVSLGRFASPSYGSSVDATSAVTAVSPTTGGKTGAEIPFREALLVVIRNVFVGCLISEETPFSPLGLRCLPWLKMAPLVDGSCWSSVEVVCWTPVAVAHLGHHQLTFSTSSVTPTHEE